MCERPPQGVLSEGSTRPAISAGPRRGGLWQRTLGAGLILQPLLLWPAPLLLVPVCLPHCCRRHPSKTERDHVTHPPIKNIGRNCLCPWVLMWGG